jgi:pimeloyl-ACP methyl ester carboxylesterase
MRTPPVYGVFKNGVPYLCFGKGPKRLLFLLGGPGNTLPVGAAVSGFRRGMQPFEVEYTIYLVSRKSGLPAGYTTRDMSDDIAEIIRAEFSGHVDLIIGFSFGGLILQHFAADHAGLSGHIVIGGAAHRVSAAALRIDRQYAQLIHAGKDRAAMAARSAAIFPGGILQKLLSVVLWIFGKALIGPVNTTFRQDVLVEAQAEQAHDAIDSLRRISVPVLIVCGTDDFAFPLADVREMADLIAHSTLKVYERGHSTVFLDPHFAGDVREFTG